MCWLNKHTDPPYNSTEQGAVVFFGVSTTGLLHMITSPYVLSLRRLADGSFEAVKPVITGGS